MKGTTYLLFGLLFVSPYLAHAGFEPNNIIRHWIYVNNPEFVVIEEGGEYEIPLNKEFLTHYGGFDHPERKSRALLFKGTLNNAEKRNIHAGFKLSTFQLETYREYGDYFVVMHESNGDSDRNKRILHWLESGTTTDPTAHPPSYWGIINFKIIPPQPEETNDEPVVIIPGILGSFEKKGELVLDPILHTYDDLIELFEANGYTKEEKLFTFPYNWRWDNTITARLLGKKIEEIKEICECEKVDIIAHSMGGLVARQYIQSDDYADDVDDLVFMGVPHLGGAESYTAWEAGDLGSGFDSFLLEFFLEKEGKEKGYGSLFEYVREEPIKSIEQLLPTINYIKDKDVSGFRDYPNGYPRNLFLENLNQNINILLDKDIDIFSVIGDIGVSTIFGYEVEDYFGDIWEHGRPINFGENNDGIFFRNGDGTVIRESASFVSNDFEIESEHRELPTEARERVFKEITKESPTNIPTPFEIVKDVLIIKALSPVDIVVVAPNGEKIGNGFDEIEGAFYSGEEDDFITIPNPQEGEYAIQVIGTDEGGEYTISSALIDGETFEENDITEYILLNEENDISLVLGDGIQTQENTDVSEESVFQNLNTLLELGFIEKNFHKTLSNMLNASITPKGKGAKGVQESFIKHLELGFEKGWINELGFHVLLDDIQTLFEL